MKLSFAMRVSVPPDVLVSEIGGESVFLNLSGGSYFGLDEVGTRMWDALTHTDSLQAAYEILLGECDVDPEPLKNDLQDLVERLVKHGLLQIT